MLLIGFFHVVGSGRDGYAFGLSLGSYAAEAPSAGSRGCGPKNHRDSNRHTSMSPNPAAKLVPTRNAKCGGDPLRV